MDDDPEVEKRGNPLDQGDQEEVQETQEGPTNQKRRRSISDEGVGPEPRFHSMITRNNLQKRHGDLLEDMPEAKHHKAFISQVIHLLKEVPEAGQHRAFISQMIESDPT